MKSGFRGVSLPPGTPLPANEFFHVNTFVGGYDSRDAQEDLPPGSSPSMLDMEVSRDDRLIRAPGVTQVENLARIPTQVILHPGFKYSSELLFLNAPYIGVKTNGSTVWTDVGLRPGTQGYTNFAGVLLLSNGTGGIYSRQPKATKIEHIPEAPSALGMTVFAGRVVLGGTRVSDIMDFMGIGWSDATSDYKGWDIANGAGAQSMISTGKMADRFQAFAPNGFDTLAILNRRSIWIANPTGDVFQPLNIVPRIEDTGCISAATVVPTEFGILFLSDEGVRIFTGNAAPVVSDQINQDLLPLSDLATYSASFDPSRQRYYLHTPSETWVFDIPRHRWYRWKGVFSASVFFPNQPSPGTKWSEAVGTWGQQTKAWWQFLPNESGGKMYFTRLGRLGYENPSSFSVFGNALTPQWFDRRHVEDNQDRLMTGLVARLTYEAESAAGIEVWLPDKPDGNPEFVATATLASGSATKRAQVPFIHTGRGISLGLKITSGSPRIRKAAVEYQTTGMLWEGDSLPIVDVIIPPTDALMRSKLVWMDHFSAGKAQSIGDDRSLQTASSSTKFGRYYDRSPDSTFTLSNTGGRVGGGVVTALVDNVFFHMAADEAPLSGDSPDFTLQGGINSTHDLQGKVITVPTTLQRIGYVRIQVMPDHTMRTILSNDYNDASAGGSILGVSTSKVPEIGIFTIESQYSASPAQEYVKGGFIIAKLYTDDLPVEGVDVVHAVGVNTNTVAFDPTVYVPKDTQLHGWAIAGPYGEVARWQYDLMLAAAMPVADGMIESKIRHAHTEVYGLTYPDANPALISTDLTWGVAERWQNVISKTHSAYNVDERLNVDWAMGELSSSTNRWLPPTTPPSVPVVDPIVSNALWNGAKDFYRVALSVTKPIAELVSFGPFALTGYHQIQGRFDISFVAFRQWLPWSFTGPNPLNGPDSYLGSIAQHLFRLATKADDGTITYGRMGAALPGYPGFEGIDSEWRCMQRYQISPPTLFDAVAGTTLPQVGIITDYTKLNEVTGLVDNQRWLQVNVAQAGLDVAFRARPAPITIPRQLNPVANLTLWSQNNLTGVLIVYDTSVDFNGTHEEIVSGIVSRLIDWNDGTPTTSLSGGIANKVSHTYVDTGDYTPTIIVTNAIGLTNTSTLNFIVRAGVIVAGLGAATNSDDPTGLTIDFIDTTTVEGGTATAWDWDFGDGSAHGTIQNPTHVYDAEGTYRIVLIATGNRGQVDTTTSDIEVVAPVIGGDCGLSTEAIADTPFVMGDDFNGGNPPLPAYLNTAGFDAYYLETIFREAYWNNYDSINDGISHSLDPDTLFNGHKTLKMAFGGSYDTAGWDTFLTDDDPISETETDQQGVWIRIRLRSETDIVPTPLPSSAFTGLAIIGCSGNNYECDLYLRNGRLVLDLDTTPVYPGPSVTTSLDLGPDTLVLGTAGFKDILMLCDGDPIAKTLHYGVWIVDACGLPGAVPLVEGTIANQRGNSSTGYVFFFNNFYSGRAPATKFLWVADWEVVPVSVAANPFVVTVS